MTPQDLKALSADIGCPIVDRAEEDSFAWDGKTIAGNDRPGSPRSTSDLVHDMAHYLCAASRRRILPEFGLGPSPSGWSRTAKRTVTQGHAQSEEECASLLGIIIERQIGADYMETWRDHAWGMVRGTIVVLRRLQRRGLVRGRPAKAVLPC